MVSNSYNHGKNNGRWRFSITILLALIVQAALIMPYASNAQETIAPNISTDIEKESAQKVTADCKTQPCHADIDSILNELNTEYKKDQQHITNTVGEKSTDTNSEPGPVISTKYAKLIVLNKITAKSSTHTLKVGEVKFFGNLSIEVHKCMKNTDPLETNNLMLLTVFDKRIDEDDLSVFHGWVMSSNPSLSTLEHPVYEIIPLECTMENKK
ncbi:MAG: hypothetical protein Tsb006_5750 [Rickettsiaceae bacterium]